MLFSSYTFLFQFLPATVLAFLAARRHSPRAGILVLAGASLFFYGAWQPIYLLLLIASVAMNFSLGLGMEDPLRRPAIGAFGVALNLAVLCYFKYTGFILDTVSMVSGIPLIFSDIVLPLGISFFTFQQIAYLVDIMRGAKVERDIVSYTLFVCFFPHLIAGPLVHHAEMIPQFKRSRTGRSAVLAARGLAIFAAGLFKKVVLADNLAQFASPVFAHLDAGGGVPTSWAWLATLAYTLQIYFDFSGYSDMAIGLALLFGIRLPVNFRSPYQAVSIIEFWRRWHVTLSRFLRDYLYSAPGLTEKGLSWAITLFAVVIAWVFFRAKTMAGAGKMLGSLFGFDGVGVAYEPTGVLWMMDLPILVGPERLLLIGGGMVALAFAIALFLPNVSQIFGYHEYRRAPEQYAFVRWHPNAAWALFTALALSSSLFGMWQRLEFLYFQF